jgi:pimeloyl-ACP methyl ester carboxylesterase
MESGGEDTNGFAQSLCDLCDLLSAVEKTDRLKDCEISIVGHSWGAFSALNILALHPDVAHVVAISGFLSVKDMHKQIFHGFLSLYRKKAYAMEKESNSEHAHFDAVSTLGKTDAQVLIIASDNDEVVKTSLHHKKLEKSLRGKSNIRFMLVEGRDHNPNYTLDAVKYKREFSKRLSKMRKEGLLNTPEQKKAFVDEVDWFKMTEQDELVWQKILETLKK